MALEQVAVHARRRGRWELSTTSLIAACIIAAAAAVLTRAFVVQTFRIPSTSMLPTLLVGDLVLVNKLAYGLVLPGGERVFSEARPQRGEVVVFYRFSEFEPLSSEKHYIKRVAAIPGDLVEVRDYITYVNGQPVQHQVPLLGAELDLSDGSGRNYGPVKLKRREYFVLGDNSANSQDSRYFGPISLNDIHGRAMMVLWSWEKPQDPNESRRIRWNRIALKIR